MSDTFDVIIDASQVTEVAERDFDAPARPRTR